MKTIFVISLFAVLVIGTQETKAEQRESQEIHYQWVSERGHVDHGKTTFSSEDTFEGLKSLVANEAQADPTTMKVYGPNGEEIRTHEQFNKILDEQSGKEAVKLTIQR